MNAHAAISYVVLDEAPLQMLHQNYTRSQSYKMYKWNKVDINKRE